MAKSYLILVDAAADGAGFNCLQIWDDKEDGNGNGKPPASSKTHESGKGLRRLMAAGDSVTWKAVVGTSNLSVTFAGDTPFSFAGNTTPQIASGAVSGVALNGRYKYSITLTTKDGATYTEDPQIVIDGNRDDYPFANRKSKRRK